MATRKEVAGLAGVSVATVSYVLNKTKKVTPEVEKRVLEAVDALGYRPNLVARSLSTKKTRHVAMLVDNLQNPHYTELLSGAQSVASENGYIVSIIPVDVSQPHDILELTGRGVEGVILALGADYPLVFQLLDPALPRAQVGPYITFNFEHAMDDMIRDLTRLGHRKIAFLTGLPAEFTDHERIIFWKAALERAGLEFSPELLIPTAPGTRMDPAEGIHAMNSLLDSGEEFTAVYAMNDLMALGAIRALKARGLQIPGDVSVVGNDRLSLLQDVSPSLATLDIHAVELGRLLMRQLIQTISMQPCCRATVIADYIPGETVGPARRT